MRWLLAEINVNWYLVPLILVTSVMYSATRFEDWALIWKYALRWGVYVGSFLGGTWAFLWLVPLDLAWYWYAMVSAVVVALIWWGGGPSSKHETDHRGADSDGAAAPPA